MILNYIDKLIQEFFHPSAFDGEYSNILDYDRTSVKIPEIEPYLRKIHDEDRENITILHKYDPKALTQNLSNNKDFDSLYSYPDEKEAFKAFHKNISKNEDKLSLEDYKKYIKIGNYINRMDTKENLDNIKLNHQKELENERFSHQNELRNAVDRQKYIGLGVGAAGLGGYALGRKKKS